MAEQVNIASLTIDVDDVIKESAKLKKEIDGLKKAQKELDTTTEEGAETYEKYDAQLKNLSKSYRDNQKFASALDKANEDLVKTMKVEGKSVQQLRDDRAALNQISKQIIGDTEEENELREQLNETINAQTEALKEQAPEYIQNKENIGGYTEGINAADFNLRSFISKSEEAGGSTNLLAGGIKAGTKAMYGLIKSAVAFIATPVGIVLAAIAGAFLLIKNAMNRSEDSTTKVKKAFSAFTGIVKGLLKFLEPLGDFLIDGLVAGFELVEKGLFKTMKAIQRGLEFLGLDEAAASLGKFTEEIEESVKASKELVDAELAFAKAQRLARITQLNYLKEAEKLRQIRDDETKSFDERIKANKELGEVLDKQMKEELALAQNALDVANLRIKLNGETTDSLDEQADALTEIADIQERITGQVSEQLVNRVSLEREAAEAIQEIQDTANEAAVEQAKEKAEAAVELAKHELNAYIRTNQSKLQSDKFLTEEALKEEQKRLDGVAEKRREAAKKELAEGAISKIAYNEAIDTIDAEHQAAKDELELVRKEALAEQAAIDAENYLAVLALDGENQLAVLTQALEQERLAEVNAAKKTGADVSLINKKFALKQELIDKEVNDAKLQQYSQSFGEIAALLGENTVAAKLAGLAQTAINTYLGVSQILAAPSLLPEPAGSIAKGVSIAGVIATGLSSAAKISGISTKLSKGDILKGASHTRGGIPFSIGGKLGFEAEGGEALINKKSTSMFAPLLSAINEAGGGKKFAEGSILGTASSIASGSIVDYDLLSVRIAQAVSSLPPPVVSVSEIQEVANNVDVVESLATV